jgi:SAM-dependent methyltransferase
MGTESRPSRRSDSFDQVADLYDRYRPAPPAPVVDALTKAAGIDTGTRVLEFGCGTGQLSVPLATAGATLTCVEPGARLAERAARNLSRFPFATVECATFEDWPLPVERFDAVLVANAFHWLDPDLRVTKPLALLHPGGTLAILHTHHVRGGTAAFFEASQHAYLRYGLAADLSFRPPQSDEVPACYPELGEIRGYSSVQRERFEMPTRYTTAEYVGLLQTDSLVNTLDPDPRRRFLVDIASLIDNSFQGVVERNYLYELIVARVIRD